MTSRLGYIPTLALDTFTLCSMGIMGALERVQSAHAMEYSNKVIMGLNRNHNLSCGARTRL